MVLGRDLRLGLKNLSFNHAPTETMHVDLNSCFAAIEQQANPKLRGRPTVVAAYANQNGCILAASLEAKKLGIQTGWRVGEAQKIFSDLKILPPDPDKYRDVHRRLVHLLSRFSPQVHPKSIDEAVLLFDGVRNLSRNVWKDAQLIKCAIKNEIGEWLTVSIGLGPNRFLAKTAAAINKPDGLEEINHRNVFEQLAKLSLTQLCGINQAFQFRLNQSGIFTTTGFLKANLEQLRQVFKVIGAYQWYLRLRGWEVDDILFHRKSIGHSYALPRRITRLDDLKTILYRLCEKAGQRLRDNGYQTSEICLGLIYQDWSSIYQRHHLPQPIRNSDDIHTQARRILGRMNLDPGVRNLAVSLSRLSPASRQQQTLFEDLGKKAALTRALDDINTRYGAFTITKASVMELRKNILDRIAFGRAGNYPTNLPDGK